MSKLAEELLTLSPSARIELFVVDATSLGGLLTRFYNGTNQLSQAVVWQGQTYTAMPIDATGFEATADGAAPRPTLRLSNQGGLIGAYARQFGGLLGALLIRKQTRAKYLDAVNFAGGFNPLADPTAAYPDEVWNVDRQGRRDRLLIEWELASPADMEGAVTPGRQVRETICGSAYRSSECGYTGGAVATADDVATAVLAQDKCSLKVSGCKLRFGANAELPIDIFPGAGRLRNV